MRKTKTVNAKLLIAWTPPDGAGQAVGCLATTYTFSPVFFEEECLSRFLQMQSDAIEDGPVYIIEREEKLSEIQCVSVLVDASHCKGDRSLRWDLLDARVPHAILHAKISLLCWRNLVRVVIGSANLTEDGFRRNREIYGVIDYQPGGDAPRAFLNAIVDYLREAVGYAVSGEDEPVPAIRRWTVLLETVLAYSRHWDTTPSAAGKKAVLIDAILTGPGRPSAFEQFAALWPEGAPPSDAVVTSPFFDSPGSPNRPAQEPWALLKKRGAARVIYNLTAEDIPNEPALFLHAPREIITAQPQGRPGVETLLKRLDDSSDKDDTPLRRPLHLKSYLFSGSDWYAYMIGSGNFTTKGLGLSTYSNLEANVLYRVSNSGNPKALKQLQASVPQGAVIDKNLQLKWQPKSEQGEDAPEELMVVIPEAFGAAIYSNEGQAQTVELHIHGTPPSGWRLYRQPDLAAIFYDEVRWSAEGKPKKIPLTWDQSAPPSGFEVAWRDGTGRAWWPINIDRPASLPPPAELRDLPLDVLVSILTSARPLHQVLSTWLKKKGKIPTSGPIVDPYNPHKNVDTSGFLLQKTYRVTSALAGLRSKLARPVSSQDALHWRLGGPVGVDAVAQAIAKEARNPDEKAFLLTELALEISRVLPCSAPGCLPEDQIIKEIQERIRGLKEQVFGCLPNASQGLKNYIDSAFKEALL